MNEESERHHVPQHWIYQYASEEFLFKFEEGKTKFPWELGAKINISHSFSNLGPLSLFHFNFMTGS